MSPLQTAALIGLVLYFALLLFAVTREKKNHNVLDYFFAGRSLPFWALSITFVASWWGAGSAISTADLAYTDGLGAFWYYGVPVLLATFLMMLGARAIRRVPFLTQGAMMEARYSPAVARLLSVMILIFMTFSAASQMVGIGSFFSVYLGLDYTLAVLAGAGIVLIYSLFGGFRGWCLPAWRARCCSTPCPRAAWFRLSGPANPPPRSSWGWGCRWPPMWWSACVPRPTPTGPTGSSNRRGCCAAIPPEFSARRGRRSPGARFVLRINGPATGKLSLNNCFGGAVWSSAKSNTPGC